MNMGIAEVADNFFAVSDAKLHGEMCKTLSTRYCKVLAIFPELEEARPRSKSGIQALCSLHVSLEKAKNVLQHCSECSKLYLAITGDSVLQKFDKARSSLVDSLKRVEDIVPQSIGCQICEIVNDLDSVVFTLEPLEKQIGEELISLLQKGGKFSECNDNNELECFHQAAMKLGITSSRTALAERRALKKLIERARAEEDKRKEFIVEYLLHLMRKYSKLFRNEFSDDNDSQGSTPCSPTVMGSLEEGGHGGNHAFERHLSRLSSFNFRPSIRRSGPIQLVPPEELRCPISLQLMYDPVIISSGQTYERICIEKWFRDGHNTCPKTQQKLTHLCLTPNYCVKGLIGSWCDQNGVPVPDCPPESLDLNYWRLALSDSDTTDSRRIDSIGSCKLKSMKVDPLEDCGIIEEEGYELENPCEEEDQELGVNLLESHGDLLKVLNGEDDMMDKCRAAEKIRRLLKDEEEARILMGANGFVAALLNFLEQAIHDHNFVAQEVGAMALFNLAVNNNRNKELMLEAQVIPLLEEMISNRISQGPSTALYLNLSCLEEAKPIIGSGPAVPRLVNILRDESDLQCKLDALHTLYNLSTNSSNIHSLLISGIVPALQSLLATYEDQNWAEKSMALLVNLASNPMGKDEVGSSSELIGGIASVLDTGDPAEQELAAFCLLLLCDANDMCIQMVLQEGIIPALVSISVNGTPRGMENAQKLLMLFREQRKRERSHFSPQLVEQSPQQPPPPPTTTEMGYNKAVKEGKPFCKPMSRRKMSKGWRSLWKSKSHSVFQC
ncbi:hypothetical protein SAY87_016120 [Trapa incisa]|uniref:RING-type E3 ubiquitin transferase n=1 Tax=Trapa incisa TaxID=236973 RepID=A0AAN7L9F4_9MYRT|nr:hypothetical protein SAY87_016120 [Trapa incisa]